MSARPGPSQLQAGARNLLQDCAGLERGDSVLLVFEDPRLEWWDREIVDTVAQQAEDLGLTVELLETGAPTNRRDENIQPAMQRHDCSVFFARVGDQDRFTAPAAGGRIVMCYARNRPMLASEFGRVSFQAMKRLKLALDAVITNASRIEITCPQGTRLIGSMPPGQSANAEDVTIRRFPMGIVSPVDAAFFSGRVALTGYLTPTGSAVYEPACLRLETRVFASIENGVITGFDGPAAEVDRIEKHYRHVAGLFDLEAFVVHSWHAGIHPGLVYAGCEDDDPDLWGNTVFNHPRYLHFHTCGNHPPGEISWLISDHRVRLDGVDLWRDGRLLPENFAASRQCLVDSTDLRSLFAKSSAAPATTVA